MQIKTCNQINRLITEERWSDAGQLVLQEIGQTQVQIRNKQQALSVCRNLFQWLLDNEMYLHAAALQWGPDMFSAEPECVQRVFAALQKNAKVLFCGASSMGKSFNAGVWMYLDWRRDPYYTSIKCVGISDDQVRKHVFSHMLRMHSICAIPMLEEVSIRESDMWMGIKGAGNEFGITAVAYKQSEETSGGLRGYKSMPVRKIKHPKFGFMSRLRIIGDEGNQWPAGPFKGINTIVSQIDGTELVKISISYNPESVSQYIVELSRPPNGWSPDDLETLHDWESAYGWAVCRLDAARSENVIHKKKIYEGLQTYDGFIGYLKGGGDGSASYWCYARGFPPLKGSINTIIPPAWPSESRGEAVFIETPITCAAIDLAFMGKDSAQMAVGRWGLASGFRDKDRKFKPFMDRLNVAREKPRHVLQIDQILPMAKHDDTVKMAEEIIGRCKNMEIKPEWVAVDKMQPVSEPVLTPSGWKRIGDMKVGDYVIGSNGKKTKVTGVYPQKDRRVLRIEFTDGSWTRCGPEHLWRVKDCKYGHWNTITTEQVSTYMEKYGGLKIPIVSSPVEFDCNPELKIHPYLLGCLLGDGNIRESNVRFSSNDREILEKISSVLPDGVKITHTDRCNYIFGAEKKKCDKTGMFVPNNKLLCELRGYGLTGKHSWDKFIPYDYMTASVDDRLSLLRGIMDTDGFLQGGGAGIRLCNKTLINQVIELVESLGGSCRYTSHKTFCNGVECRLAHKLSIAMPDGINPFSLKRKADKFHRKVKLAFRVVKKITKLDDEDSVCIRVDAEDHLYLTRHAIVTHNTGYGFGTWSHLQKVWGPVFGISWNEKATARKILAEDQVGADGQVEGVMSEMWWAFRRWMDPTCCALLINDIIPHQPIHTQLTSRRYRNGKNGIKVEPKEEYVARNKTSPDEADALVMLVHVVRNNSEVIPGLVEQQSKAKAGRSNQGAVKFMTHKQMAESIETDDYQGPDNQD